MSAMLLDIVGSFPGSTAWSHLAHFAAENLDRRLDGWVLQHVGRRSRCGGRARVVRYGVHTNAGRLPVEGRHQLLQKLQRGSRSELAAKFLLGHAEHEEIGRA